MGATGGQLASAADRVRPAGPERAGEVAALHRTLFDPGWDEVAVRRLLALPASLAFVAEMPRQEAIAGFVLAQVAADEAEILSLGVAPVCQNAGLGRRLVEHLIGTLRASAVRRLYLEVAADNHTALACYRRLRFEPVGLRPSYYARRADVPVDAIVLARAL